MTPAEHLARADEIIRHLDSPDNDNHWSTSAAVTQLAITHALIAIGAQLGVPHQHLTGGGGDIDAAHL